MIGIICQHRSGLTCIVFLFNSSPHLACKVTFKNTNLPILLPNSSFSSYKPRLQEVLVYNTNLFSPQECLGVFWAAYFSQKKKSIDYPLMHINLCISMDVCNILHLKYGTRCPSVMHSPFWSKSEAFPYCIN